MANTDKNILITPNSGSANANPTIVFSGANGEVGPQNITLTVTPNANGTVNFNASSGNLLVIRNDLSNTIYTDGTIVSANIQATNGIFTNVSGNGSLLTSISAANITGNVSNANNAVTAQTVTNNAQPNITSVGTLSSLSVTGNVTASYFFGNGSQLTGVAAGTSNTAETVTNNAQPNITSVGILTSLSVSGNANVGNISATNGVFTNVSGNGALLTSITGANITGQVANATYATSAGTANTVTNNAQPNITSVGVLNSLSVNGNITAGNIDGGNLTTANYILGSSEVRIGNPSSENWSRIQHLNTSNAYGFQSPLGQMLVITNEEATVKQALVLADATTSYSSPMFGVSVYEGANSGPSTGNETWTPIFTVTGTGDISTAGLVTAGSANIIGNANVGNLGSAGLITATGNIRGANLNTTGILSVGGNASVGNLTASANVTANFFIGNGSQLTGISAGTANTAETVTNNAQPNITSVGTLTSLSVSGNANVGNIAATNGIFTNVSGNGAALSSITGANVTGTVANATYATSAGSATTAGTVTTAAQPNITSVGTLTALSVNGNANVGNLGITGLITATGNIQGGNLITSGQVSATGNVTGNFFIGNGSQLVGVNAGTAITAQTVTNAAQPNITSVGTLTSLSVSGNANIGNLGTAGLITATGTITGGNLSTAGTLSVGGNANVGNIGATNGIFTNISGNGSGLSSITGANVTGQVANALVAGTVYTNAQPNITSVGTLTSLSVNGNANIGNIGTTGVFATTLSATGNANVSNLNANFGYFANDIIVNGNLQVNGNLTYINVDTLAVEDPIIQLGTGPNGAPPAANSGKDVGTALEYFDASAKTAFMGWDVSNAEIAFGSNVSITNEVVTFNQLANTRVGNLLTTGVSATGNVTANFFIGNGSQLTGISASSGTANTVTNNAQPNITSVGTLTSLSVSGNADVGNISATNGVFTNVLGNGAQLSSLNASNLTTGIILSGRISGNYTGITGVGTLGTGSITNTFGNINIGSNVFTGNGSGLTAIPGANVTGQVANALVAGTVYSNAQPNITSVGTLTSLSVSGNASIGNLDINGTINATGAITGGSISTAGALSAGGNANVGNLGTAGSITASGNVSGGNVNTNGLVSAAGNVSGGNINTIGLVSATGSITGGSISTAGALSAGGNANVGNLGTNGTITAAGAITGGSISTAGALSAGGNANVGNLGTNGTITAVGNINGGNVNATTIILRNNRNVPTYVAQPSAPANPLLGDQWYDTDTGVLYQYQSDGTNSYWQDMSTNVGTLPTLSVTGDLAAGTVYTNSISSLNTFGFKNRIINGDMSVNQRSTGNVTLASTATYIIDRWAGFEDTDGAMVAARDSTAPTGFVNSLKFTTTTADGTLSATQFAAAAQYIEGLNIADLAWGTASAKTLTLSFWVRSSITGTFGGAVRNSALNRSYPFTYSISAANTWEQKSVTIPGDTTGTWLTNTSTGISLMFGLGVGSTYSGTAGSWSGSELISATGAQSIIGTLNATWFITGVQFEIGSIATSFDFRGYSAELILCKRYFQTYSAPPLRGVFANGFVARSGMVLPVEMRSSPTTNVTGTFYTYDGDLIFDSTSANILGSFNSTRNIEIDYSVSGGSTTIGRAAVLYDYELASDTFTFDSELS